MEQSRNTPPEAAPDGSASSATPGTGVARAGDSNSRAISPLRPDTDAVPSLARNRRLRHDGWTAARIRTFLDRLSECGVVTDAARAAGMSVMSAYRFRNRVEGRAFNLAWNAALQLARRRMTDEVISRALDGCVEKIHRNGELWGERRRFDNRLTMAVLTRLEEQADSRQEKYLSARVVADEFDAFVDIVAAGGDGAAEFVSTRVERESKFYGNREADLLARMDPAFEPAAATASIADNSDAMGRDPLMAALFKSLMQP